MEKWEKSAALEIDSWQPKILAINGPQHNCWLINLATNIYIYNDWLLMTEYQKQSTKNGGSMLDGISPG